MTKIFFRHTFICPECENHNYRVTDNPDPCRDYPHIDCGSCQQRIPMTTHHGTDVCLPSIVDSDLIAAAIIFAVRGNLCDDENLESFAQSCPVYIRMLKKELAKDRDK